MLIRILLVISIVIQCVATGYALRLVRTTKYNSVWILFIVGFSLLSVERLIQLLLESGVQVISRWWFAYLGIVISVCLSIGVMYAHKLFKYIDRLNRQRSLLNKRILTAVLRTEEKARSRFSKELHDGLGPLLSSAKMSLSALSREEQSPEQREIIANTTYVIDEAIRSLREISNNLSPHVLNDFGLARGVQNFIDKSAAMHDVKIRFTTGATPVKCELGYSYCYDTYGLQRDDQRFAEAFKPFETYEQVFTTSPSVFRYGDIFAITFSPGSTDLKGASEVYLCGTAVHDGGQRTEVTTAGDKNRMSVSGSRFEKYIYPKDFFGLPSDAVIEELSFYFTNADGTIVVKDDENGGEEFFVGQSAE